MRFLVDAQLPTALARWLEARGHHAEHAADIGMESSPDVALWQRALDTHSVLVSKDADFMHLVTLRSPSPKLVWVRIGNTRRAQLLAEFNEALECIIATLEEGEAIVELWSGQQPSRP